MRNRTMNVIYKLMEKKNKQNKLGLVTELKQIQNHFNVNAKLSLKIFFEFLFTNFESSQGKLFTAFLAPFLYYSNL